MRAMNFFAHATVALWQSSNPRFLLGAMLPDLTGMMRMRLFGTRDAELSAGIDYHHATDAAFHSAPTFVALCAQGSTFLTAAGVGRGTARAVAHVGTELLLDGVLSHDANARAAYAHALQTAIADGLVSQLELGAPDDRQQLHAGLLRLATAPIPEGYRDPSFVGARLQTTLARRPRLAMRESDLEAVHRFLVSSHAQIAQVGPELLAQVRDGLAESARYAST
jgi:acyl carrier protein phosphodiesterase